VAKKLIEAFYKQVMVDGFFHADPHPGNLMWQPEEEKLYFLDLGMVGEVDAQMREHMMLLHMAFWQEDVGFLTDVSLMLSGAIDRSDLDVQAFQTEIGGLMARYRGASLSEGGKPIIALPSTTSAGESRIVAQLMPGAGVVTTRAHVHYLVTEYGVANLYGQNLRQRARALIGIAHPRHRDDLAREAHRRFGGLG
jgi:predicted unusual protein kinase regulating ubiquinone biosynthesis (AarF/ABC1/UbiB family)